MKKFLILFIVCCFGCFFAGCELDIPEPSQTHTHIYSQAKIETMPTCTKKGKIRFTCDCGESYYAEFSATGHNYMATVINPTCTENGYTLYKCACGESYIKDETPALGHEYANEITAPTCTEQGYTTYTCIRCSDYFIGNYTDALGHEYEEWQITEEPNCTRKGIKTAVCIRCPETVTEEINVSEHISLTAVEEDRIDSTCITQGCYDSVVYCAVCGTELSRETITLDIAAHEYIIDETTIRKATDDLYLFNLICNICGDTTKVNAAKIDTVLPTCCEQGYSIYEYYYFMGDKIIRDTVKLDYTATTPHLHTVYDEDGEPVQFSAYGLGDNNTTYIITPQIQRLIDSGTIKLNGGRMTGDTELATFDCAHCNKLIVIRLEKKND